MAFGVAETFLIVSGLILLGDGLTKVPSIGKDLQRFSKWLSGFGIFIGLINIIIAVIAIF